MRLVTEGEGTEVDKTVIERLTDPLTHMIRNAIDHGLESPKRASPPASRPRAPSASRPLHRSGRIVIEVADDGGGINRARVLASAIAKGLIAADAALTDEEIDNLIFLPGFSTAPRRLRHLRPRRRHGRGQALDPGARRPDLHHVAARARARPSP